MTEPVLLAVVEVPHDERVRCSAEGCGHSVFRRVHLVRVDGNTKVFGSDCFGRLFGTSAVGRSNPTYTGGTGRSLTPEERELLIHNTERLIEQFEQEHQAAIAEAERRRALRGQHNATAACPTDVEVRKPEIQRSSPAQRVAAEVEARKSLGERFPGVNLDIPGFVGLLRMEIEKILRTQPND